MHLFYMIPKIRQTYLIVFVLLPLSVEQDSKDGEYNPKDPLPIYQGMDGQSHHQILEQLLPMFDQELMLCGAGACGIWCLVIAWAVQFPAGSKREILGVTFGAGRP